MARVEDMVHSPSVRELSFPLCPLFSHRQCKTQYYYCELIIYYKRCLLVTCNAQPRLHRSSPFMAA